VRACAPQRSLHGRRTPTCMDGRAV
jgi:hypothetical protein